MPILSLFPPFFLSLLSTFPFFEFVIVVVLFCFRFFWLWFFCSFNLFCVIFPFFFFFFFSSLFFSSSSSSSWRSQSTRSRPLGRWMTSSSPAPACSRRVWSSGKCWQATRLLLWLRKGGISVEHAPRSALLDHRGKLARVSASVYGAYDCSVYYDRCEASQEFFLFCIAFCSRCQCGSGGELWRKERRRAQNRRAAQRCRAKRKRMEAAMMEVATHRPHRSKARVK